MTKSYVSMEQKVCVVCGMTYDTNALLMDRRLKDSMEQHTITGYGACPEHQKLADDGFIALIGANELTASKSLNLSEVDRTGELVFFKKEIFEKMFNTTLNPSRFPMVFVEPEIITKLKNIVTKSSERTIQ